MYSEFRETALQRLLESISNRRLIQHLRLQLFRNVDFEPKNLVNLNLTNSTIQEDIFHWIKITAKDILEQLKENTWIYKFYFLPISQGLTENVRDLLLPGEEEKFAWEIIYEECLEKFINDNRRLEMDPIGYYQKIYEFLTLDLTYNDQWESLVV